MRIYWQQLQKIRYKNRKKMLKHSPWDHVYKYIIYQWHWKEWKTWFWNKYKHLPSWSITRQKLNSSSGRQNWSHHQKSSSIKTRLGCIEKEGSMRAIRLVKRKKCDNNLEKWEIVFIKKVSNDLFRISPRQHQTISNPSRQRSCQSNPVIWSSG